MLGCPELLQMDRLAEEDILLLQISSDYPAGIAQKTPYPATGMMWGDAGSVYYAIGDADLKARNFANATAWLEDQ